jgi:hypothetical protein
MATGTASILFCLVFIGLGASAWDSVTGGAIVYPAASVKKAEGGRRRIFLPFFNLPSKMFDKYFFKFKFKFFEKYEEKKILISF